jgi:hypothetical protein
MQCPESLGNERFQDVSTAQGSVSAGEGDRERVLTDLSGRPTRGLCGLAAGARAHASPRGGYSVYVSVTHFDVQIRQGAEPCIPRACIRRQITQGYTDQTLLRAARLKDSRDLGRDPNSPQEGVRPHVRGRKRGSLSVRPT